MLIPGRWSSDGEGIGLAGQIKATVVQNWQLEGARRSGVIKLGAENSALEIPKLGKSDVYDFLARQGGWEGHLQQRIDAEAGQKRFHWGSEIMNARSDHAAMARDTQLHASAGEHAWSDLASWDLQETVSSYVHIVGILVAHGGRRIHHTYVRGSSGGAGIGTKGCQGFVNWNWALVPPPMRPLLDWYASRPRGPHRPEPGNWRGEHLEDLEDASDEEG